MDDQTKVRLAEQLKRHEQDGKIALHPYKCPAGKLTIGWGHNYQDKPLLPDIAAHLKQNGEITPIMADRQLIADINDAEHSAQTKCPVYDDLGGVRQAVIVNMAFNMGDGFITAGSKAYWPVFNDCLSRLDFQGVVKSMKNSRWYRQVGNRAKELMAQMGKGEWI